MPVEFSSGDRMILQEGGAHWQTGEIGIPMPRMYNKRSGWLQEFES
jgi:hypothetical protein